MPVSIDFPEFTDETVFLEDMEAANNFFGSITVPDATSISYGVVKRAASIAGDLASISAPITLTVYRVEVLKVDGSYDYAELCDQTEVQTALNQMRTVINSLVAALQDAGVLAA